MRPHSTVPTIDPGLCPLCGQSNRCAMEVQRETGVPQGPCWCTKAVFEPALLGRITPEARGKACVCERCARQGHKLGSEPGG